MENKTCLKPPTSIVLAENSHTWSFSLTINKIITVFAKIPCKIKYAPACSVRIYAFPDITEYYRLFRHQEDQQNSQMGFYSHFTTSYMPFHHLTSTSCFTPIDVCK